MLRPATPLTLLFFVAFVLLLLSTISTPIVKAIPLASFNGVNFGVFGYCKSTGCSNSQIGYSVDPDNDDSDFSLSSSTRSDLSSILVVHPIATFLTLICFIMAATSHLHSPSHSPRYLLGLMILSIPTLLITLLAFLVDILLFIPHLAWGGWIVLAATILILASGIVTCAMRRTLVSRKARKKRIAENAEMNGENFYARQAAPPAMPVDRAESPPPLTKEPAMSDSDKLPAFATFETKNGADDDRIPLNTRTPSNKTLPSMPSSGGPTYSDDGNSRYGVPGRGGPGGIRGGRGERYDGPSDQDGNPMNNGFYDGPRDEYGNVLPSSNAFGPPPSAGMRRDQSEPPMMRRQYSDETMNSQSSRGRGRGGYPSRGYGRGVPYGPGRGGYVRGGIPTGVMAAGAGAGIVAGDRRRGLEPHPPGYGNGYPPQGRPGQYNAPGPGGYGRSPSAPGYGRHPSSGTPSAPGAFDRQSPGPPSAPGGYANGAIAYGRRPSGENPGSYGSGPSPAGPPLHPGGYGYAMSGPKSGPQQYRNEPSPPLPLQHPGGGEIIGQAIEMDARTGSPGTASPSFARPMLLRDSDSDVQGFVDLQQQSKGKAHRDSPASLTSVYSANEHYVPPRAAWTGVTPGVTPTPNTTTMNPVELPAQNITRKARSDSRPIAHTSGSHRRNKSSADNYYEDVDPRFAAQEQSRDTIRQNPNIQSSSAVPSSLMPGLSNIPSDLPQPVHSAIETVDPSSSYESIHDGHRSPASDNSNMTSISQRRVNPNWRPPPDGGNYRVGQANLIPPGRRQQHQQRDMLLNTNPDFEIAGVREARVPPAMGGQQGQAF